MVVNIQFTLLVLPSWMKFWSVTVSRSFEILLLQSKNNHRWGCLVHARFSEHLTLQWLHSDKCKDSYKLWITAVSLILKSKICWRIESTTEDLSHDSLSPSQNLTGTPTYKGEVLTCKLQHLVQKAKHLCSPTAHLKLKLFQDTNTHTDHIIITLLAVF
jgi:hypothetical protein